MSDEESLVIVNKIFKMVFNKENNMNMEELLEKFAFDVKLPKQVNDSINN